jgi:polysaccharide export outer membrane protein
MVGMAATYTRSSIARWLVIGIAACFAAGGCQTVEMRGQQDQELLPFPEAENNTGTDGSLRDTQAQPDGEAKPFVKPPTAAEQKAKPKAESPTKTAATPAPTMEELVGQPPIHGAPSELCMTSLPTYVVEAPDILLIEAVKLVPKPPYRIEPLDILQIVVVGTLLGQDIQGQFAVDPSGFIDLGPAYGRVHVAGQSLDESTKTIDHFLRRILRSPEVSVVLASTSGQQQVAGEHLIGLDGTINLGTYGSIYVAGMTIAEVKDAVEQHLSKYLLDPVVGVEVFAYQSKNYYIISQGAGLGDGVTRVPITGNETVLDALAQVNGLSRLASKKIWIARPVPNERGCDQILPVNYADITAGANTATNFQLLPGDRVFIAEDKFIALESAITKITAPMERLFGFGMLGAQTIQTFNRFPLGFQGGNVF